MMHSKVCYYCRVAKAVYGTVCPTCREVHSEAITAGYGLMKVFEKQHMYLYFLDINAGEKIKIGITNHPEQRLAGIESEHKCKVKPIGWILGNAAIEKQTHALFKEFRTKKGYWRCEWFYPDQSILDYAEKQTKPLNEVTQEMWAKWDEYRLEVLMKHGKLAHMHLWSPSNS